MNIDNLNWHDGVLIETSFYIDKKGQSKLVVIADFYSNEDSKKRSKYKISCEGVVKCNLSLDAVELRDNMFAGNISNGYLKTKTFWLYFTDGVLEVTAQDFDVVQC